MEFAIGGGVLIAVGVVLFLSAYMARSSESLLNVLATTGVVVITAGLIAFMLAGFVVHGKSTGRADTKEALREQHFAVISIDEYGGSATVRGPGGCAARVTVEQVRGTGQKLIMQGSRVVTPRSVSCP